MPVLDKRWVRADIDEPRATTIADQCGVDEHTARLLVGRGVTDAGAVDAYLNPRLAHLPDPALLKGLTPAAIRVADAIEAGHKVALYGDYDVDGVTSTSLLAAFMTSEGLAPRTYIPKRLTEGYGLNAGAVDELAGEGTQLLITLDCGITATREIARANEHGIDCIVVDHHRCPPELPHAFATLNPQQADCTYPDKGLAAVGVCFNLVVGVRKVLRERGRYEGREQPNLRRYLDLVALGTIADMVPLSGVNRVLAWYGVQELRAARRPGVRALMEVSKVRWARCSSSDVGFRLGPRINAAGRLSDASYGVRLLLTDQMDEARKLAATLDAANAQRQQIEREVVEAVIEQIEGRELPDAIVLYDDQWHPGVVGIVASKIVERYERPTIIIGEGGRGSARTARGLHLYNAINDVSDYLMKFGGHRAAAGLTIEPGKIPAFRAALIERVRADDGLGDAVATVVYDDELPLKALSYDFACELARLEPFGNGNPQPLFKTTGATVKSARLVGKDHLKLRLTQGNLPSIEGIAFSRGDMHAEMTEGREIELISHLERSEFSGMEHLELRIRDLRVTN